jgi:hypothetical protein
MITLFEDIHQTERALGRNLRKNWEKMEKERNLLLVLLPTTDDAKN